jgi:hypothetical protein
MTKKEGIETIQICQDIDNLFFGKPKDMDIYVDYTTFDLAQNLADFTGKAVLLEINQKILVQPFKEEQTNETPKEVIT